MDRGFATLAVLVDFKAKAPQKKCCGTRHEPTNPTAKVPHQDPATLGYMFSIVDQVAPS